MAKGIVDRERMGECNLFGVRKLSLGAVKYSGAALNRQQQTGRRLSYIDSRT